MALAFAFFMCKKDHILQITAEKVKETRCLLFLESFSVFFFCLSGTDLAGFAQCPLGHERTDKFID